MANSALGQCAAENGFCRELPHHHGARRRLLQESPRVLGVGLGVFLLGFFLVVFVVLGLLGSRTTKPKLSYAVAATLYGILVVALIASPKGDPPVPSPLGYDQSVVPLVVMLALVSGSAVGSLVGLLLFHVRAAVYARPLSYHIDVLHQL